ncbi:P-loop containing nucleoside triphosphate hydrolase protein [Naematelia encephala]|uniref:p-loop containing nucleoside triphosphate hydrolase protein n=1 Tax=Naematelia encephala TaxID=71784 RepID=A0A1Y2AJF7_9TREE|nr:P-loop containing nucleoside triphosphate hydrolase protein [Naematelia encephala]
MSPLLSIKGLTLRRDDGTGSAILNDFSMDVEEGEVVIIKGESGSGKTTLLKCIAELNVYQSGEILLHDKKTTSYGIPTYRTLVQYIPQRPSLLPGTPLDLLETIRSFSSRKSSKSKSTSTSGIDGEDDSNDDLDPMRLASEWGIQRTLWTREWATLSGGEGQRIALALGIGIGGAEVVLLDEPTSALDAETMKKVENSLLSLLPPLKTQPSTSNGVRRRGIGPKAYVWITHEAAQAERCGTRTVDITRR